MVWRVTPVLEKVERKCAREVLRLMPSSSEASSRVRPLANNMASWVSAGVKSNSPVPYLVTTFCAMLPWQLFESAVTQAGNSLVGNQNLISKVYFPRLSIPISTIVSGLPDFGIAFVILLGMMGWYRVVPGVAVLAVPLFVLLALAAALAVGLWLSALNVQYRDVRYAIPFLTRLWFFATPVVYPSDLVRKLPAAWQVVYGLNPMAGVVEGFRWAMLGEAAPAWRLILASGAATLVLLVGGLYYFRRVEQTFADVV